jgi:DNA-binding transcriptional ArsR family regulator
MPRRPATTRLSAEKMRAHAADTTRLLKALANEKRLMILCLLVDSERTVGELNALLDLSQSALSQHLAVLRDDGFVQTRRHAQSVVYSLPSGPAKRIIDLLHKVYCGAHD